ncbi:MAG: hypothetical protein V1716_00270 [Candidatus Uhrbacteria bacterium]
MKGEIFWPDGDVQKTLSPEQVLQTLQNCVHIDMFDSVVDSLRKKGVELPENLEELERRALKRYIESLETSISRLEYSANQEDQAARQEFIEEIKRLQDRLDKSKIE